MEQMLLEQISFSLEKAQREGQPVEELLDAVRAGEEMAVCIGSVKNGKCELRMSFWDKEQGRRWPSLRLLINP